MNRDIAFRKLVEMISSLHQMEDSLLSMVKRPELTDLQQSMMTILYLSGPKNLSSLSSCLNINLPNCSREVKKLSESGLVKKEPSREDRRVTHLSLSDDGRREVEALFAEMKELFFRSAGDWNEERSARLIQALDVIHQELQGIS